MDRAASNHAAHRRGRLLVWLGFLLAQGAMGTYFFLAPRWPDLRDSGLANVVLGALGAVLGAAGAWQCFAARRGRVSSLVVFAFTLAAASLLWFYIGWLSYQMPSGEGAPAIGARAPSFRLPDQEGRERTLEELAGRRLVLVFFRGHW